MGWLKEIDMTGWRRGFNVCHVEGMVGFCCGRVSRNMMVMMVVVKMMVVK